jgi:hypothetical protein
VIRFLAALLLAIAPAEAQVVWGGAGSGAAIGAGSYWFYTAYPNVTLTGAQSEAVMFDVPVPANVLGPVGMLRVTTQWSTSNNANAKTPRIRWSTSAMNLLGASIGAITGVASVSVMQQQIVVRNTGATNAQSAFLIGGMSAYGNTTFAPGTTNVDTTQATHLTITGTLGVGTDVLTLQGITVEALHP